MTWNTQFRTFFENLFGEPQGSAPFFTISCVALGSLILFSWIITNFVSDGRKGPFRSFFAQALPGLAALLGWIGTRIYAGPHIQPSSPLQTLLPILGAIIAALVVSGFTARRLAGTSVKSGIVSLVLTYAVVTGVIYLGGSLVRDMDSSLTQLEKKKEQRDNDTRSIIENKDSGISHSTY
tara:strand:+ start:5693 stop:6232 length:540 start_codon:yes stop_codon:yes gene_type:complete